MKSLIKKIFNSKKEIDSREYRKVMRLFFSNREWPYQDTITSVKVFKIKDVVSVEIEAHRPGLLIGKGGNFIDALQKELKDYFQSNIKINLKECQLWINLYKNNKHGSN